MTKLTQITELNSLLSYQVKWYDVNQDEFYFIWTILAGLNTKLSWICISSA